MGQATREACCSAGSAPIKPIETTKSQIKLDRVCRSRGREDAEAGVGQEKSRRILEVADFTVVVAEKVTCIRGLPLQVLPYLYSVLVYVSTDLGIYVRQ